MAPSSSRPPKKISPVVREAITGAGADATMSTAGFRQLISVRKVRDRLGGGDPVELSRQIDAIESEFTEGKGVLRVSVPGLEVAITKVVSNAPATGQTTEVSRPRAEPGCSMVQADVTTMALMKSQLTELRQRIAARDFELSSIVSRFARLDERRIALEAKLEDCEKRLADAISEQQAIRWTCERELREERFRHLMELTEQSIHFLRELNDTVEFYGRLDSRRSLERRTAAEADNLHNGEREK